MTSREQFEAWYLESQVNEPEFLQRQPDGRYLFNTTTRLWLTWQASRHALVVKLPEEYVLPPATDYDTLAAACRQQDREAIEAAGVRVKL